MNKRLFLSLIPLVLIIAVFTGCATLKLHLPEEQKPVLESYTWANDAHSSYFYNNIDSKLQAPYKKVAKACLSLTNKVELPRLSANELDIIIRSIMADYPVINWLSDTYTYANNLKGGTTLRLEYTKGQGEIDLILNKLDEKTTKLLSDISPDYSDYEKAAIVHDKLVDLITYDLEAENQRTVQGAILENVATCEGYAKAYQFLLSKLGIEAIIVYGTANEPHAWNVVNLDGDYYYVDVTFDDRDLSEGGGYLSREYLFVNEKQLTKTHTLSGDDVNPFLPKCTKTKLNYFVKSKALIKEISANEIKRAIKSEAEKAIKKREKSFQIKFDDTISVDTVNSMLMGGSLDQAARSEVEKYRSLRYSGRTYEEVTNVVTFLINY